MPNTDTFKLVDAGADIDWLRIAKDVTYQLRTPIGWISVTRDAYRTITHQHNRRILLKVERKAINSELFDVR